MGVIESMEMPEGPEGLAVTFTLNTPSVAFPDQRDFVIQEIIAASQRAVQEAEAKAPLVPGARWQMVGRLPSGLHR